MPQRFIIYSPVDDAFVKRLVGRLRTAFPGLKVWRGVRRQISGVVLSVLLGSGVTITAAAPLLRDSPPTAVVQASDTPDPVPAALDAARRFTGGNADWGALYPGGFEHTFADGVTMVLVPAGSFEMGSTAAEIDAAFEMCRQAAADDSTCEHAWFEDEAHDANTQTFTQPFWIDQTEVTRAQYQRCVEAGGCEQTPESDFSTDADQPVNRVSWFQAQTYCAWRGGSLPTEAEWEYAARGPERWIFPWGSAFDGSLANHCDGRCSEERWASGLHYVNEENDDGYGGTSPAGAYPGGASWVGALDMSGSFREWTSSLHEPYPYDRDDGRELDTGGSTDVLRVLRGGSFIDSSYGMRSAHRYWNNPDVGYDYNGFRCVRSG
ncbi:MAG: formylglycine-generating enzyme family protein [Anaerolineae bacterium]|nr:formylglycine-generating enzyme family protein [Anaerolineae bacterium]NUQ05235.1 formylglycine-generating enzyme family protein [Anaerolineae bacterium]